MPEDAALLSLADQTLWVTALIAGPVLVATLVVGLVVGIIQAATSVNEQTLSFIPKLIAMALALLLFGSWMLVTLVDFTRSIFERIPTLFI